MPFVNDMEHEKKSVSWAYQIIKSSSSKLIYMLFNVWLYNKKPNRCIHAMS